MAHIDIGALTNPDIIYTHTYPEGRNYNSSTARWLQLDISTTPKPKDNSTDVHWKVSVVGYSQYKVAAGPVEVRIGGTKCYSFDNYATSGGGFPREAGTSKSGTINIKHNDNGSKSVDVYFKAAVGASAVHSWGGTLKLTTYDLTAPKIDSFNCTAATATSSNATFKFTANHNCTYEIYPNGSSSYLRRKNNKSSGTYTENGFTASGDQNTYVLKVTDEYNGKAATKVSTCYNASPEVTANFKPVTSATGSYSSCNFTSNVAGTYRIRKSGTDLKSGNCAANTPVTISDLAASNGVNSYELIVTRNANGFSTSKTIKTDNTIPIVTLVSYKPLSYNTSTLTFRVDTYSRVMIWCEGSVIKTLDVSANTNQTVTLEPGVAGNKEITYELVAINVATGVSTLVNTYNFTTDNRYTSLLEHTFSPVSTERSEVTFKVDRDSTISFRTNEEYGSPEVQVLANNQYTITLPAKVGFNWYKIIAKTKSSGLVQEYYNKTGNDTTYRTDNNRPSLSNFTYSLPSPGQAKFSTTVNGLSDSSYEWKYKIEPLDDEFSDPIDKLNATVVKKRNIQENTIKDYTVVVQRADCEIKSNPETRSVTIDNRVPTIENVILEYNTDLFSRNLTFYCNLNDCSVLWKKDPDSSESKIAVSKILWGTGENSGKYKYICTVPINSSVSDCSLKLMRGASHGSTSATENIKYDGRYPVIELEHSVAGNSVSIKATATSNVDGTPLDCKWTLNLMEGTTVSQTFESSEDASTIEHLFTGLPMQKDLVCVVKAEYFTGASQSESTDVFQAKGFVYIKQEDTLTQGIIYVLQLDEQGNKIWVPGTPYVLADDKTWHYGTLSQTPGGEE